MKPSNNVNSALLKLQLQQITVYEMVLRWPTNLVLVNHFNLQFKSLILAFNSLNHSHASPVKHTNHPCYHTYLACSPGTGLLWGLLFQIWGFFGLKMSGCYPPILECTVSGTEVKVSIALTSESYCSHS